MSRTIGAASAALLCLASGAAMAAGISPDGTLPVGRFSATAAERKLPSDWTPLTFDNIDRHTRYELVDEQGARVVRAVSDSAASGLIRRIRIDPNEFPLVQWRWKIANVIDRSDVTQKAGDDYPARIYITFEYDPERASFLDAAKYRAARALFGADTPYRALNYIWERKAPRGSIVPNPYTDWAMMVVVRSGADDVGRWITEERNIVEDYRKAYGTEPPKISGVAIMTDTDNTKSSATAWYGDIVFRKGNPAR